MYDIIESKASLRAVSKVSYLGFVSIKCAECLAGDQLCETDRVGFEAIAQLHSQIDDDHDGSLNRAESAEVLTLLSGVEIIAFVNELLHISPVFHKLLLI